MSQPNAPKPATDAYVNHQIQGVLDYLYDEEKLGKQRDARIKEIERVLNFLIADANEQTKLQIKRKDNNVAGFFH